MKRWNYQYRWIIGEICEKHSTWTAVIKASNYQPDLFLKAISISITRQYGRKIIFFSEIKWRSQTRSCLACFHVLVNSFEHVRLISRLYTNVFTLLPSGRDKNLFLNLTIFFFYCILDSSSTTRLKSMACHRKSQRVPPNGKFKDGKRFHKEFPNIKFWVFFFFNLLFWPLRPEDLCLGAWTGGQIQKVVISFTRPQVLIAWRDSDRQRR